jgi:hypothetical protein
MRKFGLTLAAAGLIMGLTATYLVLDDDMTGEPQGWYLGLGFTGAATIVSGVLFAAVAR